MGLRLHLSRLRTGGKTSNTFWALVEGGLDFEMKICHRGLEHRLGARKAQLITDQSSKGPTYTGTSQREAYLD